MTGNRRTRTGNGALVVSPVVWHPRHNLPGSGTPDSTQPGGLHDPLQHKIPGPFTHMVPPTSDTDLTPDPSTSDETRERILDAAVNLFLEFGYRRTTIETVARRLGVSRVTVYRYFADKTALFQAVLLRDLQRSALDIEQHLNTLSIEQNPVIEGFTLAVTLARQHPLIRRLLDTEPEWLVLHMTLRGENMLQWSSITASNFLQQPKFREWLKETDMTLAGELFVRLLLSAMLTPGGLLTSDNPDDLRRVAGYLIQPLLRQPPQ